MKYVIIGGVAAGTKAAAKIKRQDRSAEVCIYTKSTDISYAGCGLPYYVGGSIETREELIVNTPEKFAALTGAGVFTGMEATGVDAASKTVMFRNVTSGTEESVAYDKLIIATGAAPFVPNVSGTDLAGVFTMRTPDDAIGLRDYVSANNCRSAVVVGGGFIGLEIAENLMAKGLKVTVADMADQIMPNLFDSEMADFMRRKLQAKGMRIVTSAALEEILGTEKATGIRTSVGTFDGDLVVLAIGIRPATAFLADSGIEMNRGTIVVDAKQQTNLPDIYAVGDGPIDAAYNAIDAIIKPSEHSFDIFNIHSISEGKDTLGDVTVKVNAYDRTFTGRGLSTDIMEASINAYLKALNRMIAYEKKYKGK